MAKIQEQFNPEIELGPNERASLVVMAASEGFKVLHRILRSEVDKFIIDLINQDSDDDAAVLGKHKLAKAAAIVYDGITNRINGEIEAYASTHNVDPVPVDPTAKLLDYGPEPSTFEDIEQDTIDGLEEGPF